MAFTTITETVAVSLINLSLSGVITLSEDDALKLKETIAGSETLQDHVKLQISNMKKNLANAESLLDV